MAKVLLVDTNFSSGPIYQELQVMGHDVHVVGNNPGDYLAKMSPNYWKLDYADTDALGALIDQQGYDFLVPGCTDRSYLSCVAVGAGRFPGLDQAYACDTVFNKANFRRLVEGLGLPAPARLAADQLPACWPVIVKPVDAFSGKGITVLREGDSSAFMQAVATARAASPSGEHLVETFVEGQLYSHSAFLLDGRVIQDFLVQENSTANPFVVDTSRIVAGASTAMLNQLRRCAESMAAKLDLVDGLLHTQFIGTDDALWLIETTRRCPGDLYSQLIELTTGYPYVRSYVQSFLGAAAEKGHGDLRCDPIMRHTVTLRAAQNFAFLRFRVALHIERWTPLSVAGDQLQPSPQGRIGVLFCRAADAQDLDHLYKITLDRNLYEVRA
jgi:hypothetical protein